MKQLLSKKAREQIADNDKQAINLVRDVKRLKRHNHSVKLNDNKIIDFILETHDKNNSWLRTELDKQTKS